MGDEKLGRLYGESWVALSYLIDRQGKVRAQFQGEVDLTRSRSSSRPCSTVEPAARALPKGQGAVNRFVSFGAERATAELGRGKNLI